MRSNFRNRFTIFDAMEARGVFAANPANADSIHQTEGTSLYKGPVPYPKMLYHPEGKTRVLVAGEVLRGSDGYPRIGRDGQELVVGEQREIIWKIVNDAAEEEALLSEGWHTHPSMAIAAGGGEAPPMSSDQRIRELEEQLERAKKALDVAKQQPTAVVRKKVAAAPAASLAPPVELSDELLSQ